MYLHNSGLSALQRLHMLYCTSRGDVHLHVASSKSTVCRSYALTCISTEKLETEVVELITFSYDYENMAVLVRYFKNPFMGQLLLILVHLPQT